MPSATGGIARLVWARLREAGIQADGLLSRAGLTLEQIEDRKARLSVESQIKFLELGAEALHDDALGFHLARDFDLREIGLLYYVAASSGTVAEALSKTERYCRLANEGISLRFAAKDMAIALSYVGVERRSDRHQIEFWVTSIIRIQPRTDQPPRGAKPCQSRPSPSSDARGGQVVPGLRDRVRIRRR